MMTSTSRWSPSGLGVFLSVAAVVVISAGCNSILNPQFTSLLSGNVFPAAPGDTNFVLVRMVNNTTLDLTYRVAVETTDGSRTVDVDIPTGVDPIGSVFECPVFRLGLGDLNDPNSTALVISDPVTGRFFDVPLGRNPLTQGVSYDCGDTILFLASQDDDVPGGVLISVGRIDGSTQQGPFSGADTFEILEEIVISATP